MFIEQNVKQAELYKDVVRRTIKNAFGSHAADVVYYKKEGKTKPGTKIMYCKHPFSIRIRQSRIQVICYDLPVLNFRHRASSVLGQAFRYSPENAFYIFKQQIYFVI